MISLVCCPAEAGGQRAWSWTNGHPVAVEAVPEVALAAGSLDWPTATLPVFIAMMFGATLGGNATLIGTSANLVRVASAPRRVSTSASGASYARSTDHAGAVGGRGAV